MLPINFVAKFVQRCCGSIKCHLQIDFHTLLANCNLVVCTFLIIFDLVEVESWTCLFVSI